MISGKEIILDGTSFVILSYALAVAITQCLLLWRIRKLDQELDHVHRELHNVALALALHVAGKDIWFFKDRGWPLRRSEEE